MRDARWEKIERIFHNVRVLEGADRVRFLDEECGSDIRMRRELELLLEHAAKTKGFLDQPGALLLSDTTSPQLRDVRRISDGATESTRNLGDYHSSKEMQ